MCDKVKPDKLPSCVLWFGRGQTQSCRTFKKDAYIRIVSSLLVNTCLFIVEMGRWTVLYQYLSNILGFKIDKFD